MFSKHPEHVLADASTDLRDEQDWKLGSLRILDFPLDITSLAVEPVIGLLAVGTSSGIIYVFGSPGVEFKLTIPRSVRIRFLHFATSTHNIVCLDDNNDLHVWDLLSFGRPKLVASAHFDQTTSITLCPSHTHVFLAMHNGDVKTYDLACLRKSKYNMPNMWKLYQATIKKTGAPALTSPSPSTSVETVIHPRNLNLVFVAYAGGVILTDLTERSTLRAYELILLPGAPGGAGYGKDILTHRRLTVTCLAIHPSGHFFAVGHTDGSIAFWAVEDDDQPLLVQTLDSTDVNLVDFDATTADPDNTEKNQKQQLTREPIFKLSWSSFSNSSDPRGGETTLTILGGLDASKPPGLTVFLFPPFNPTEPPSTPLSPKNENLHPFFRSSMISSFKLSKSFFYETFGSVVQDYLLIPRNSPHLAGNFDPYAILLLTESTHNARTVRAYQYPPPGFVKPNLDLPEAPIEAETKEDVEELPSASLQSPPPPTPPEKSPRLINYTPSPIRTPFTLSAASSGILGGCLFKIENDVYRSFVDEDFKDLHLTLNGGQIYADSDLKLSKYQPHRVLATYNRDLSVQFFDMSAQLLIPTNDAPLDQDFPKPLPGFTIYPDDLLDDSSISKILLPHIETLSIQSVHVAPEALECAVALTSGDIVVYHSAMGLSPSKVTADMEIILLNHIRPTPGRRFEPYFMLNPNRGLIATCAMSDTGFLAVSYMDGSLIVVDMRGPKIILSHEANNRKNKPKRQSVHGRTHGGNGPSLPGSNLDVAKSLTWTICPLDKDRQLSVRLIAAYQSGHAEIYTLAHSGNPVSWSVVGEPVPCKAMADPLPDGTFVVDTQGELIGADRARLAASFRVPTDTPPCLMITVGAKGARCNFNIDGEKVAKIEWGSKVGLVQSVQIVKNLRSHTLVVQTDRHDMLVYSIPHLEYLHTVQLPSVSSLPLAIDASGDFIAWAADPVSKLISSATYGTFFDFRRSNTLPDVDFSTSRGKILSQPQPVSLGPTSFLGSWFSFNQTKTGEQIDELLGGPDRPVLEKISERGDGATSEEGVAGTTASAASSLAASAAAVQSSIYDRLSSAMNDRGQMLGDLEQRFNSLEEGGRSMVDQAKRLAAQQATKGWFGF